MANDFVANAGILKVYWSIGAQLAINVYGVRVPAGVTITQSIADALGAAIKTAYDTNLAPRQNGSVGLVKVGIRDYRAPNLPELRDSSPTHLGSEPTVDALPNGVALCITLRTALSGKSFRGRSYIPGFSESNNDAGGGILTASATAAVTYVNGIKNALSASGMFLAVLSRPSDRYVTTRTHYHPDGTTTIDTLSDESARVGGVADVTVIESRTPRWEYQRRRDNGRGAALGSLVSVVSSTSLGLT